LLGAVIGHRQFPLVTFFDFRSGENGDWDVISIFVLKVNLMLKMITIIHVNDFC
jgi:hypothetical protein